MIKLASFILSFIEKYANFAKIRISSLADITQTSASLTTRPIEFQA